MITRLILIILDSAGIGAMPDARDYLDEGTNTLGNIARAIGGLSLPNMEKFGLGKLVDLKKPPPDGIIGCYGKMAEASKGKDTLTGHWEMTGLILKKPFPLYPNGFPKRIIDEFEKRIKRKTIGNYAASGTEIIKQLGEEHVKTGYPIVYTSADSVFQIAMHEDVIPVEEQHRICMTAREILKGDDAVGRVIARPFIGTPGNFKRTANRRDFGISPFGKTLLDDMQAAGFGVVGIGKIHDIFNGQGVSESLHTESNLDGINRTIEAIKNKIGKCFIFTNLVDFDTLWGHRRDVDGYVKGLKEFDGKLPEIIGSLNENDILFISADHGCDPTYPKHTDHTREYVPLLIYGKKTKRNVDIGLRKTFADLGQTMADILGLKPLGNGKSFKKEIMQPRTL